MNKKLFCGLLFVMFAIFIFAGCGGGGGSSYITQNDPIEYSTKPTQVNPDGTVKISTVSNWDGLDTPTPKLKNVGGQE